jgi:hypothetical protein
MRSTSQAVARHAKGPGGARRGVPVDAATGTPRGDGQLWSSATAVLGSTSDSAAEIRKAAAAYGAACVNDVANEWLPR